MPAQIEPAVEEFQLGRAWRNLKETEGGAEVVEAAVHH